MSDFKEKMLYFASPALLGRKQANLFSFPIGYITDYRKEIETYQKEFAPLDISVEYLYSRHQQLCHRQKKNDGTGSSQSKHCIPAGTPMHT